MALYDKKMMRKRISAIDIILNKVNGMTVLDIGGNNGFISLELLKHGAKLAHVFDIIPKKDVMHYSNLIYRSTDICSWDKFEEDHKDILLQSYDIVMFLGTYHHLCEKSRYSIFKKSVDLATKYFCFRCNNRFFIDLKKELPKKWNKKGQFVWQVL